MTVAFSRVLPSGCTNPFLVLFVFKDGQLLDPISAEFQIFDISTPKLRVTPVQVFPAMGREPVDLTACPAGDRLGLGRFVATYAPDAAEALGTHLIRWFVTKETGDPEVEFEEEFDILADDIPFVDSYATITDMRDEGVTEEIADDARLVVALRLARSYIERITGQFFEPRFLDFFEDGRGGEKILFGIPVIALEDIIIETPLATTPPVQQDFFRVFNRHIEQGLRQPDDRNNPKVELIFRRRLESDLPLNIFPLGVQNVHFTGVFGFTEADGSSGGGTPLEIRHVTKLLALRELPPIIDIDERQELLQRFRLSAERTREQSRTYGIVRGRGQSAMYGYFTGDPTIDTILASYMRVPALGAA